MSRMLPVLHGAAKAVSPAEFYDALRAVCPPRFPAIPPAKRRAVGLAISGGVDSMALAYLCSQVRRVDPWLKVADHEVQQFRGMVVDHRMRAGSREEAEAVVAVLKEKMGLAADLLTMRWQVDDALPEEADPNELPNVESVARRLRYRILGDNASAKRIASILLAHHEDDQCETVFMRLLNGHGVRGLRGMRSATDIPECEDKHGVYHSGLLDDIRCQDPLYRVGVSKRERKWLKHDLRAALDKDEIARELREGSDLDWGKHPFFNEPPDESRKRSRPAPTLEPMEIEDGGVLLYRPLLEFGKERLIATCVENKIPWFEDATNQDPTLTMRNAVRHLFKGYELPAALQKPAILQLAKRCQQKAAAEEAEAERLMSRTVIGNHDFEPNVGTLLVQLPDLKLPTVTWRSRHSVLRRERRRDHYARIATVLIQKLLSFVSPEQHLTPPSDLTSMAARLFPSLSDPSQPWNPKSFTVCGVHFIPVSSPGQPLRWYLARAPYASNQPRPELSRRRRRPSRNFLTRLSRWRFSQWSPLALYDNRWWVSLRTRSTMEFRLAPLEAEYMKEFKELLGPKQRAELAAALKAYAPGKVRYTLPAVYAVGDIMVLVTEENSRVQGVKIGGGGGEEAVDGLVAEVAAGDHPVEEGLDTQKQVQPASSSIVLRHDRCSMHTMSLLRDGKLRLVALPTLGIGIPGIERWIRWQFRYKKVDVGALMKSMSPEDYRVRKRLARLRRQRMTEALEKRMRTRIRPTPPRGASQ